MTRKQQEEKARQIRAAAAEATRRLRIEMEAICMNPFCCNKRRHLVVSGVCKFNCK
jgi:hypothetical protein